MIKIGIDLDNCIFDSEPVYKEGFKGTNYTYYLPKTYLISKTYPKEVVNNLINIFQSPIMYNTIPYDNTLAPYMNNLIERNVCEFYIITARKSFNDPFIDTINQLQRHNFKIPLSNIHITPLEKISHILNCNIDYMIDDNPHVMEECLKTKVIPILISNEKTPYNQYLRDKVEWHPDVKTALKVITR